MTTREYMSVSAIVIIGLVPSFFVYRYLHNNSSILTSLECGVTQIEQTSRAAISASTTSNNSNSDITDVYQSRPQKKPIGLCKNSYYMSFTLVFTNGGEFSLMKRCESARDPSFVWYGTASTTWTTHDGKTEQTRGFSITSDENGAYKKPISIILSRNNSEIKVYETELNEISTTTIFARMPMIGEKINP